MAVLPETRSGESINHGHRFKLLTASDLDDVTDGSRSLQGLNTTEYLRGSWFIHQQQVTGYQVRQSLLPSHNPFTQSLPIPEPHPWALGQRGKGNV